MARLELIDQGAAGLRHILDGLEVHAGDVLELQTGTGWRLGRYEWTFRRSDLPVLYWDDQRGVVIRDGDELRWPAR